MLHLVRLAFCAAGLTIAAAPVTDTFAQRPAGGPQGAPREFETRVDASEPWQDAGVLIEAGQRVTIQAFGTWRDRAGATDANGRPSQIANGYENDVAMPGAPVMMLVGKIGADGPPFRIGVQTQFRSPRIGQLFLAANDRFPAFRDHRGLLTVRIVTSRAVPNAARGAEGFGDQFEANVAAREVWQDSGLYIETPGQRLAIQASGTWGDRAGTTDVNGRPSQPLNGRRDEIALPGAPAMMLVGKIGDEGVPFRIGMQTEVTASRPGELLLMANDRYLALDDNRGIVHVRITMLREVPPRPPRGSDRGSDRGSNRGGEQVDATINAKEPWQDSGVFLETGQIVTISASGTWGDGAGMTDANGRASQMLFGRRNEIALPSAPVMLLVGKISEDGVPFRIGTELRLTATRAGPLLLMANDRFDTLNDNRGRMSVRIVRPRGGQQASGERQGNADRQGNPDQVRLTVNAADPWQDTGLYIEAGQAITIVASGTWGDPAGNTNAGGRTSQILNGRRNEIAMPGAPVMMLVARIGSQGTPFRVGLRMEQVAQRGGNLFLMANDRFDMLSDNQGMLRVTVLFR